MTLLRFVASRARLLMVRRAAHVLLRERARARGNLFVICSAGAPRSTRGGRHVVRLEAGL